MRTPALITACLLIAFSAFSQTRVVKGKITTFNRYPVQNVEVTSKKNREAATGLGYIKPEQLSYALTHLADENNNFCNYSDVFSLLKTNFPEVQVMNGSSGAAEGVYIRGQKSFNSEMKNEAVYEVDGMIVTDISFVNPCEIAAINLLKSGGTAIYGTQAVNGVVIIETKGHRRQTRDQ